MKTDTANKIIKFIQNNGKTTAKQLYDHLEISPQAVFKQLRMLLDTKQLIKQGKPPKVFYSIAEEKTFTRVYHFSEETSDLINHNFYSVTPSGEEKRGVDGFIYWCEKRKLNVESSAKDYMSILKKCDAYKKDGLIDGLSKMKSTFKKVFLDALYYQDFYAIERFGKTRLGQILLYAKQSQNKAQMLSLIEEIKPSVDYLIQKHAINGVGFIPPTVKRHVQLMTEIEHGLHLTVPRVALIKLKTKIIVPQKTLNKLEDRIENEINTILVDEMKTFDNVLLIDDAVGSGATLNETAHHLRKKGIVRGEIIALAVTGSFKGFDVISEV